MQALEALRTWFVVTLVISACLCVHASGRR